MQDTNFLLFFLHIGGAVALLMWAVRLVRTGMERAFAVQLRLWLRRSAKSRILASVTGAGTAILLQSSTAVAILVSNFVSKGSISTLVGLAILLGADVGSAVVAQLLLVRQEFLIPLLLLIGVFCFKRAEPTRLRPIGRILIGLALIFVSLDMIRAAAETLIDSPATLTVMQYLGRDLLMAFVIGAIIAWLVHSSVAAVLLMVTLVAQGLLPPAGAMAMVLGANLGGAFIAYILTLSSPIPARQMVAANLILRGGGAALVLFALTKSNVGLEWLGGSEAQQTINLHLAFNLGLAVLTMPFLSWIAKLSELVLPNKVESLEAAEGIGVLDPNSLEKPQLALVCAAREILHIGEQVESMLRAVQPLYENWDASVAKSIRDRDRQITRRHQDLKLYLVQLHRENLNDNENQRSHELASIAAQLEAASDAIAKNLIDLAEQLHAQGVSFSDQGRQEIGDFHDRVLTNVQLGLNVMMTQNPDAARELVAAKEAVRSVEAHLQRQHLGRLQQGLVESLETSSIHQETLRVLKQINTSFSIIGYPILSKSGDLLDSRLSNGD